MLFHVNPERQSVAPIPGRAHIVVALLDDGKLHLQAWRDGRFNASYANGNDTVLAEIPKLLEELRQELTANDAQSMRSGS